MPRASLTDLEAVRIAPTPRLPVLGDALARRLAPAGSFLVPTILYFLLAVTSLVLGGTIAAMAIIGGVVEARPLPAWTRGVVGTASLVSFVVAWLPLLWWIRRRRNGLRRVVTHGALAPAQLVARLPLPVAGGHAVVLSARLGDRDRTIRTTFPRLVQGETVEILWLAGVDVVIAFPGGRAVAAPVR